MKLIHVDVPIVIGVHELETPLATDNALWLIQTGEQTVDGIRRYYYTGQPPRRILIVMRNGEPLERVEPDDLWLALIGWDDGANSHVPLSDANRYHTRINIDRVLRLAEADAGRVAEMLDGAGTPSVRLSEIVARSSRSGRVGGWRGDIGGRPPIAPGDPTEAHAVTLPASLWRTVEAAGGGNRSLGLRRRLDTN